MIKSGYNTQYGYLGWVESINKFVLFTNEEEYIDYISEDD